MKNTLTPFLFILVFSLGCQKENLTLNHSNIVNTTSNKLLGKWTWVKSFSKHTQTVSTPLTEGYSYSMEFYNNDSVDFYKNNVLESSTRYVVDTIPTNTDTLSSSVIILFNINQIGYLYFLNDTLVLDYSYMDKLIQYYVKE